MSDYTELKSLLNKWKVPIAEYVEAGGKVVEPIAYYGAENSTTISGSCLGSIEFIFNPDESFKTIRIEGP